jgi:SpoVK/Ycf46/Vps4 family AAA+-type ATPase
MYDLAECEEMNDMNKNHDVNSNKPEDKLPDWLNQFKQELNGAKTIDTSKNPEPKQQTRYSNADFKDAESMLLNATGGEALSASDYHPFAFMNLAGYDSCVKKLKYLGISNTEKSKNSSMVAALNKFHGIPSRPALKPIVFIGDSTEEIEPLLQATTDELSCATIKMSVQETPAGLPAIVSQANKTAVQLAHGRAPLMCLSENSGLLIIENLEDWTPFFEGSSFEFGDGEHSVFSIHLTPAGKEFINLIEACVKNPNVQIICTTTCPEDIPTHLLDILGNVSEVKVEKPNIQERRQLWTKLASTHPSLRGLNFEELSKLTKHLTRTDIEKVVQEAIAESYNTSLRAGKCDSVKRENLFEKILLRQDKNTEEFKRIEEVLVDSFAHSFDFNQSITR